MVEITKKRAFKIEVNEKWCKGCELCVAFCPSKVLEMRNLKAFVANPEACTGCQLCELRCPDFAIVVYEANGKDEAE